MSEKSILVTGAASGIGKATALSFAKRGWFAGLFDIDEDGLQQVSDEIGPDMSISRRLDVVDIEQWRSAVEEFGRCTGGKMGVLFNNAGIAHIGRFEEIPADLNRRIIEVNLIGVMNGIQSSFPLLKDTDGACIVNTSSIAAELGGAMFASYGASKFGVRGLTDSLDLEFEKHGIRVCDIMPWFIETPLLQHSPMHGTNSNASLRDGIIGAGMAINEIDQVVKGVWSAVEGKRTHTLIGLSAKILGPLNQHFPRTSRIGKRQLLKKFAMKMGIT